MQTIVDLRYYIQDDPSQQLLAPPPIETLPPPSQQRLPVASRRFLEYPLLYLHRQHYDLPNGLWIFHRWAKASTDQYLSLANRHHGEEWGPHTLPGAHSLPRIAL